MVVETKLLPLVDVILCSLVFFCKYCYVEIDLFHQSIIVFFMLNS